MIRIKTFRTNRSLVPTKETSLAEKTVAFTRNAISQTAKQRAAKMFTQRKERDRVLNDHLFHFAKHFVRLTLAKVHIVRHER